MADQLAVGAEAQVVDRLAGRDLAMRTARQMEYGWRDEGQKAAAKTG